MDAVRLPRDTPRPFNAAERLGDGKTGLQAILMEAGAEVRPAEPGPRAALQ